MVFILILLSHAGFVWFDFPDYCGLLTQWPTVLAELYLCYLNFLTNV